MINKDYLFIKKLLECSNEYEEETLNIPVSSKTFAHFVHWIFNKMKAL